MIGQNTTESGNATDRSETGTLTASADKILDAVADEIAVKAVERALSDAFLTGDQVRPHGAVG